MSSTFLIPILGQDESFSVSILGNVYRFLIQWQPDPFNSWVLSFGNSSTWYLQNMAVVLGVNLLKPLQFMQLGFSIKIGYTGQETEITQYNFGTVFNLYAITDE